VRLGWRSSGSSTEVVGGRSGLDGLGFRRVTGGLGDVVMGYYTVHTYYGAGVWTLGSY
jgi:hypothetical protein